jgi:hypothetical protein
MFKMCSTAKDVPTSTPKNRKIRATEAERTSETNKKSKADKTSETDKTSEVKTVK